MTSISLFCIGWQVYQFYVHDPILLICEILGNLASTVISHRPQNTDDTNETATRQIRAAFTKCFEGHSRCPKGNVKAMPLRVLGIKEMRLRQTSQWRRLAGYAALSYCWGSDQTFRTTKNTLSNMMTKIAYEDLPKTIQDAVKVTSQLDIRYLWIDALCIVQDDEIEMACQINAMGSVYKNAVVVIAASRASAVDQGFLKIRESHWRSTAASTPILCPKNGIGQLWLAERKLARVFNHEPLSLREWTFQEMSLAPRVLMYTEDALLWQCSTISDPSLLEICTVAGETNLDYPLISHSTTEGGPHDPTDVAELWWNWDFIVTGYTQRCLTNAEDRLPALAGIAVEMKLKLKTNYLAGLWRENMKSQLGWRQELATLKELSQSRTKGLAGHGLQ
jgi:hypothetical protein